MSSPRGAGAPAPVLLVAAAVLAACASGSSFFAPTPAWDLPPPPPHEAPVVEAGALHRGTLDNGLATLVLEDHRTPMVSLGIAVPRGAGRVDPGQAGLARFTAELMERGAGSRDALAFARAVEDLGASLSVSVDWDNTYVTTSGLSRDADELFDLLADVVLRPKLDAGEAGKARDEQLAELSQATDDPETLVVWQTLRVLYPDHRYGLPMNGTPASVAPLDAAAARRFHDDVFRPEGGVFFASGDVDTDEILARASAHFGAAAWPTADPVAPAVAPPERTPTATRVVVVDKPDLAQARIIVAHEGIDRTNPDRIAVDIMNKVLGGSGFASRLMARVRSEEGLTYSIDSGFDMRRSPGPFSVSTFTRVSEAGRVVSLVLEEMRKIREQPPTPTELADAISLAVGGFGLSLESSESVAGGLVNLELYDLPPDSLDTYRSRVRAVDAAAAAEAAKRFIHPGRVAIVVLGPAAEIVPQLETFGPVEVVKP